MSSSSQPRHLNNHQRDTLLQIFAHPTSRNIEWQAGLSLLEAVGSVEQRPDGKYLVHVGEEVETFTRPRGKDLDIQQVVDIRRMLTTAGYGEVLGSARQKDAGLTESTGTELVRDKSVVAAIDFRETIIYPTDASPGQRPERIVATDPRGYFHKVSHRAGNPDGTYESDSSEYWRDVTEALSAAGAILLLGHGSGRANATHEWVAYVENHRKDVAARVVADVRVDIDHLDDHQVLRLAQYYFDGPPVREIGEHQ